MSISLSPLTSITLNELKQIVTGYQTDAVYTVDHQESDQSTAFRLTLKQLDKPLIHRFTYVNEALAKRYSSLVKDRFSIGAYNNSLELIGIAIGEPQRWNSSLSIWEFHLLPAYQRQGIGRRLLDWMTQRAREAGLRVLICETQNRNVPAIRVYRKLGFQLQAIDLSLYSNADYPDGEIGLFMKKFISPVNE